MKTRLTKKLRATAYHEAGHAVAAFHLGLRLHRVTIKPDGDTFGSAYHGNPLKNDNPEWDTSLRVRDRIERVALTSLAGPAAERRKFGRATGYRSDLHEAVNLLSYLTGSNEVLTAYVRLVFIRAKHFIAGHWLEVEAFAQALLVHRTLGARRSRAVIKEAFDAPVRARLAEMKANP